MAPLVMFLLDIGGLRLHQFGLAPSVQALWVDDKVVVAARACSSSCMMMARCHDAVFLRQHESHGGHLCGNWVVGIPLQHGQCPPS